MLSDPCSSHKHRTGTAAVVVCNARDQSREGGWQSTPWKPEEISDTASSFSHHKWHQLARRLLQEHFGDDTAVWELCVWDVKATPTRDLRSHGTGRSPLCRETGTSMEHGWRLFWKKKGEGIIPYQEEKCPGNEEEVWERQRNDKINFVWRKAYFCSQQGCHHMCTSWPN